MNRERAIKMSKQLTIQSKWEDYCENVLYCDPESRPLDRMLFFAGASGAASMVEFNGVKPSDLTLEALKNGARGVREVLNENIH